MTNCIKLMSDTYRTNLRNNVVDHTYEHLRHFLKKTHPDSKSYHTLGFLFTDNSEHIADPVLLNTLIRILRTPFERGYFCDISETWWQHLPMLLRLKRWNHIRNYRNFRVLPIIKPRRQFIQFDSQCFHQLLNGIHKMKYNDFRHPISTENNYWRSIFNVGKWLSETEDLNEPSKATAFSNRFARMASRCS